MKHISAPQGKAVGVKQRKKRGKKRGKKPKYNGKTLLKGYIWEFVVDVIENEIWKKVPDSLAPGNKAYVSNLGRAKSGSGVIITPMPQQDGYVCIQIMYKTFRIHRVIIQAFEVEKSTPAHTQVNHIDGVRSNNRLDNLEWSTPPQNIQHSYDTNPNRKSHGPKTSIPVRGKREGGEWVEYESVSHAARELGLLQGCISNSCNKGWKTGGYRFEYGEPNEPPLLPGEEWREWRTAEVSNLGRFKDSRGVVKIPTPDAQGYCRVEIGGSKKRMHILIAQVFLPAGRPDQTEVDHIDHNRSNNHISNLRWSTPSDNVQHSHDNNPNRKSNGPALMKKVRCQKQGTKEWRTFPSAPEAARVMKMSAFWIGQHCKENSVAS
jgi:hypothetical protein